MYGTLIMLNAEMVYDMVQIEFKISDLFNLRVRWIVSKSDK